MHLISNTPLLDNTQSLHYNLTMSIKEYFSPKDLEEAADLALNSSLPARFFAGGTDIMIQMMGEKTPQTRLISLKDIDSLKEISRNRYGEIFIGAMVSHAELARNPMIKKYLPALAQASGMVGSPSIRNMGTIGGNVCNASPSADTAPPLMAYGAEILVWRSGGEKRAPIEDFFRGPSENILEKGDILRGFFLRPGQEKIACYEKLGIRKALEIGIVNVCVAISIDGGGSCERLRIALGSVAPTPIRAKEAEKILEGKKISRDLVSQVIETTMGEVRPISDIRASAKYRRYIVGVLVGEAFSRLIDLGSGRDAG